MVALVQVKCLEAVIGTKSFRRAAQSLRISQPAVSGHIARLERELRLTLVERRAGGSVLTPAGHRILPYLRSFAERTEIIHCVSKGIAAAAPTTLTIGGAPRLVNHLLPAALTALDRQFTNLNVRIQQMHADELYAALRSGKAELGALEVRTDVVLPDDIVGTTMLELGPAGIGAAPGHPVLSSGVGPVHPHELYGEPLVIVSEGPSIALNDELFPPHTRSTVSVVDDLGVGVGLVRRGPGIIVITGVMSSLVDPHLLWRPLVDAPTFSVRMFHHRSRPVSEVTLAAMDLAAMWAEHYRSVFSLDPVAGDVTTCETALEARTSAIRSRG